MNNFILGFALSLSVSTFAAFDYPELVPQTILTVSEAKELAQKIEAASAQVEDRKNEIKKEKTDKIASWVEYKKSLVDKSRIDLDACNKEMSCVALVNKKLSENLGSAHESIRKVNDHYDKILFEEQKVVDKKYQSLKDALVVVKAAFMVGAIQRVLQEQDGKGDFRLETNLFLEVLEDEKSAREWVTKNLKESSYFLWSIFSSHKSAFSFASFYYRTKSVQSKTVLYLDYNLNSYSYEDLLKQILSLKENDKNPFDVDSSKILDGILKTSNGIQAYIPCIGFEQEKSKFCLGVLHNDKVSLQ